MLFALFLTLAALGGAVAGFYASRHYWGDRTARAIIAHAEQAQLRRLAEAVMRDIDEARQ